MPSALSFFVFPKSSEPTIIREEGNYILNRADDPDVFARDVLSATDHPKVTVSFHWNNANWAEDRNWQTIMAVVVLKNDEPLPLIQKMRERFRVQDPTYT